MDAEVLDLADLLRSISGGDFHDDATNKLVKLVATMRNVAQNTGGAAKGKLVITVTAKLDRGMFDIDADMKVTEPATVRGRTVLWSNENGELVRQDPRQTTLALSAPVKDGTPPVVRDIRERQAGGSD
jgi:hypothetical protein